jgi:hypothetical protein
VVRNRDLVPLADLLRSDVVYGLGDQQRRPARPAAAQPAFLTMNLLPPRIRPHRPVVSSSESSTYRKVA